MLYAKVKREEGEETRRALADAGVLNSDYKILSEGNFVFIPLTKKIPGFKTILKKGVKIERKPKSIREALKNTLDKREAEELITSFDIVGDVAILDVPEKLKSKEKEIAEAVFSVHKNVKVVAKKKGAMEGVYRVRPLQVISGEKRTETIHKENNCRFKIDPAKVYFSVRLSHERKRIIGLAGKKEKILALFAGVGPFPIEIARKNPGCRIVAVELNPPAVKYMKENIKLNKTPNVKAVEGDAKKILKNYKGWADRILMPLPKSAKLFLEDAMHSAKDGGIIHFYSFVPLKNAYDSAVSLVEKSSEKCGCRVKILNKREVRTYAPDIIQVVIDFQVLKGK